MKKRIIIILSLLSLSIGISHADEPMYGKLSLKKESKVTGNPSRWFVEGEYSYIRQLGEYEKVWSNSQTVALSAGLKFQRHYMLFFKSGYSQTDTRQDGKDGNSMVPLLIGGKYLFDLGQFQPYFAFTNGFNLIFEKFNYEGEATDDVLFEYAWQLGTGAYYMFSKNFGLNATVSYNASFYELEEQLTGFVYSGGLIYVF